MKSKKILIIDNSKGITGAYNSIITFSNCLKNEFDFHFAISSEKLSNEIKVFGFNTHLVKYLEIQKNWKLILYLPLLLFNSLKLYRIIKKHQIEIVHVNDLYNMCGVILKVLRPNIRLIYHVRLLPTSYAKSLYNYWVKIIFYFSDKVICVSKAVSYAIPPSSIKTTIYDPVLHKIDNPKINRSKIFTFLFVANYIEGKGHNYAIEAFHRLISKGCNCQLIFVGSDLGTKNIKYKQRLIDRCTSLKMEDQVSFLGYSRHLDAHYKSADVTLMFSESESFSMVCLESLTLGTPVIATKCGGPEEIIEHNVNGLLVENKNIEEMINAMKLVYEDKETLKHLISQAKPSVASKFSINISNQQLAQVYNKKT